MKDKSEMMDRGRKNLSIKSMAFNRFLIFRYVTAGFFFTNMYWMFLLFGRTGFYWLLPAALLLVNIAVAVEQTGKYWRPNHKLTLTISGYWVQLASNMALVIVMLFGFNHTFWPFINDQSQSVVLIILLVGMGVCLLLEWRARLISQDQDKYFKLLQDFKVSLQ
ncbi:MAG: PTS cellobiose transporter subunit IIC [Leuconostoc pseudomesenteroides]|uniref:PTS cellobiose transporter subunit IIC n=1 Tax=Leuconostoc pseudomesenteroides TaxID=33968 RepID=UPI0039EB175E